MISAALAVLENEEQRNELSEFFEKYKNKLYEIALKQVHNREYAADALQDTFAVIAGKPEIFFTKSEEERFLFTAVIIKNISIDYFKNNHKYDAEELTEDISDKNVSVMEQAIGECSKEELMNFIKTLSEPLRQALFFRVHYNMNTSQIASVLNISETAARKRLSDAGKKIKIFLEGKNNV